MSDDTLPKTTLTVDDVVLHLGVSKPTVYMAIKHGNIAAVRVRGKWLINSDTFYSKFGWPAHLQPPTETTPVESDGNTAKVSTLLLPATLQLLSETFRRPIEPNQSQRGTPENPWRSLGYAAKYLQRSEPSVRLLCENNKLKHYRRGRQVFFVDDYLADFRWLGNARESLKRRLLPLRKKDLSELTEIVLCPYCGCPMFGRWFNEPVRIGDDEFGSEIFPRMKLLCPLFTRQSPRCTNSGVFAGDITLSLLNHINSLAALPHQVVIDILGRERRAIERSIIKLDEERRRVVQLLAVSDEGNEDYSDRVFNLSLTKMQSMAKLDVINLHCVQLESDTSSVPAAGLAAKWVRENWYKATPSDKAELLRRFFRLVTYIPSDTISQMEIRIVKYGPALENS